MKALRSVRFELGDESSATTGASGPPRICHDIVVLPDTQKTSKMRSEAFMAKKKMGRPLKGDEPATQRVSAMLTEDEKARLDEIAAEKKWPIATLVKDCLEKCYPQVFGKEAERKE